MNESIQYQALLPEILAGAGGLLIVLLTPFLRTRKKWGPVLIPGITLVAFLGAALALFTVSWGLPQSLMKELPFSGDTFSTSFRFLLLLISILITLAARPFLEREEIYHGEFYALLLFTYLGMALLSGSQDLVSTFLGLEILSIGCYILLGLKRQDLRSNEAAWKYFLLGSISSAFFLYGAAMIFGATGSTRYADLFTLAGTPAGKPMALLLNCGLALLFVGLAFKLALVPFHSWAADVYEGAPSLIAGFFSTGPKVAAMAALMRFFNFHFPRMHYSGSHFAGWIAIASMTLGNLAAISQQNLKRMLAYSSIAHAGYMIMAIFLDNETADTTLFIYLLAYSLMNLGAFLILSLLSGKGDLEVSLHDLGGLAERRPGLAAVLSLFLLSLTGIPLTGGFTAKFYLFGSALKNGLTGLVVIAVLNSAVSAYYYLRPIVYMYMKPLPDSHASREQAAVPVGYGIAICIAVAGTLWLGIAPSFWLAFAEKVNLALK
jgi:NADH-quinone oxidoreductase subunit N